MTRYQPRHRRSNALARFFIGTAAFIVLLLSVLVIFRTNLIELALTSALDHQGLGPAELSVVRVDLSGLELKSGELAGGALSFSGAELKYSWASLSDQRFNELNLADLRINGAWTDKGLLFGRLSQIGSGADEAKFVDEPTGSANGSGGLPFDIIRVEDARISVSHPDGPIEATIDLNLTAATSPISVDATLMMTGPNLSGAARWQGELDMTDIITSSLTGNITFQADGFRVPGLGPPITADIQINASLLDGVFSITSDQPLEISAPWPDILNPIGLEAANKKSYDLSLSTTSTTAPFFQLQAEQSGLRGTIDFDLGWVTPFGRGSLGAAGWALMGKDGLPQDFKFERLAVRLDDIETPNGTIWAKIIADGLSGPLAIAGGPITMSGRIQNGSIEAASFAEINVNADTDFRLDGLSLAFSLNDLAMKIDDLTYSDTIKLAAPLEVDLSRPSNASQTATLVFGADGSTTATLDAALGISAPDVNILMEDSALSFMGDIPTFKVEGYWVSTDDAVDMQAEVQGARFQSELVTLSDVDLAVSGGLTSFAGPINAVIRRSTPQTTRRSGIMIGGTLVFEDNIFNSEGIMSLSSDIKLGNFSVRYDLDRESGHVASSVGPLLFGGQGLMQANLRPLGLPFTPTSGEFAARAMFPFGKERDGPQTGTLFLKDLELEGGYYHISRLNSAITLDAVWPPRSKGSQIASIGLLQMGLPVTDVQASFAINSAEIVDVETLSMTFAGGKISGEPFTLRLDDAESTANLDVSGVALPALARLSGLKGLEAQGTLSGQIPIRIGNDDLLIDAGILNTTGPGSIRYRPDEATHLAATDQGGMALALQALEDFQYESIAIKVSGSARNELETSLAIKGRNPALYDGYPIDFNLNVSGELANIVRDSMVGYRIPETIKQQLMGFPPTP